MGYIWNKRGSIQLADGQVICPDVGSDVTAIVEMLDDDIVIGMLEERTIADSTEKEKRNREIMAEQNRKLESAKKIADLNKAKGALVKAEKALDKADTDAKKKKAKEAVVKAKEQLAGLDKE